MKKDYNMNKTNTDNANVANEAKEEKIIKEFESFEDFLSKSSTMNLNKKCLALVRCIPHADIETFKKNIDEMNKKGWYALEFNFKQDSTSVLNDEIYEKAKESLVQKDKEMMSSCLVQANEKNFLFFGKE